MSRPRPVTRRPALAAAATALLLPAAAAFAGPAVQPFIYVEVQPTSIDLGDVVPTVPFQDAVATLTMKLYSNLTHGGVVASMQPLTRAGGGSIPASRVQIKRGDQANYVSLANPVNLTGPRPPGTTTYSIQFRVESSWSDVPGTYNGTLVLTYGVAP